MTSAQLLPNFSVTGHCRQNHNGITEYSGLKGSFRGPAAQHCESSANQVSLSKQVEVPQPLNTKSCNFCRDFVDGSKGLFDKEGQCTQCAGEQLKGTYLLGPSPAGVCPPLLHRNMRPEEPTTSGFSPRISFWRGCLVI